MNHYIRPVGKTTSLHSFEERQSIREILPENLTGVNLVKCDRREDGTTVGMFDVDGYYRLPEQELSVRQIRRYDVKSSEEARARALVDGLEFGLMVEMLISEPAPCNLRNTQTHPYTFEELTQNIHRINPRIIKAARSLLKLK